MKHINKKIFLLKSWDDKNIIIFHTTLDLTFNQVFIISIWIKNII